MRVSATNNQNFCATKTKLASKVVNRAKLKPSTTNLKPLAGPEEKRKARRWVAAYTAGNATLAAATAQAPGVDELALSGVEVIMATHIFNGIYDFKFSKTILKALAAGVAGHAIGKTTFKLISKAVTWVPVVGNGVNAVVSGTTTAALGASLIEMAEEMDEARRRGKKLDDFIKEMEK